MTEPLNPLSDNFEEEASPREPDLTVDLTLDECEAVDDLQALADEAADELPETPTHKASRQSDELSALFNEELERTLLEARDRIQELEKRDVEHLDKHHRLLADFSNYRNRTTRDIQMAVDLSERKLLLEILPVLDNFERCIGSNYQNVEDFRSGVSLIQKQFLDALRRMGVESVKRGRGRALRRPARRGPVHDQRSEAAGWSGGRRLRTRLHAPGAAAACRPGGGQPSTGRRDGQSLDVDPKRKRPYHPNITRTLGVLSWPVSSSASISAPPTAAPA